MADAQPSEDFGFKPDAAPQAANDDFGFRPAGPPQLPNTTPIQQIVQKNLAKPQEGEEQQQVQSPAQKLDTGLGFSASGALRSGDDVKNDQPLPANIRAPLIDAYKNGTATDAGDYMQSVLPAAANAASSAPEPDYTDIVKQSFLKGYAANMEAIRQGTQLSSGQTPEQPLPSDKMEHFLMDPYHDYFSKPDVKRILGKTLYGIFESSPEFGGAVAGGLTGVAAGGGPESPAALVTGPAGTFLGAAGVHYIKALAPTYAEELKANNGDQEKAWQAAKTKTGIGAAGTGVAFALFGFQPFENAVKDTLFQAFAAQPAAGAAQKAAMNVAEGRPLAEGTGSAAVEAGAATLPPLGAHFIMKATADAVPGHEALKPVVGDAIGKDPKDVTPEDINQTIASGFADKAPKAQDFHDTATVMGASVDTLHQIYAETGVHPDQVFEDAQNHAEIMADVKAGEIPSAYDHLREQPAQAADGNNEPPIPPHDAYNPEHPFEEGAPEQPERSTEGASTLINPLAKIFNPAGISESAKDMATAIRQGRGPAAQKTAQIQDGLEKFGKSFGGMSDADHLSFIHYMETRSSGGELPENLKEMQPAADLIKDIYAKMGDEMRKAFPDVGLRKDYFTHQFEDQKAADKFFSDWVSKQGSERSLKSRAFPTLEEAMEAGLKPKSTNPIETVMNYVMNMNNLIAAHKTVELAKEAGIADYFPKGEQPDGWVPMNGNLAEQGGKILYAPEDAARVYNNDISEKASGPAGDIIDAYQRTNNFVSKLVLGLSGYHFTATTMASMASDVAQGTLKGTMRAFTPLVETRQGSNLINGYLGRTELPPELQKTLDLAVKNNTINVKQQDYWKAGPAKDYIDAFKTGSLSTELKAAGQTLKDNPVTGPVRILANEVGRVMDTVSKPLFDYYIPRLKISANIAELHAWLEKNPDATLEEQDRAAQDIGNSIDNRFGEMMRDNLFWHQLTRQTLQLALLSYSWVTGAARMVKGTTDIAQTALGKIGIMEGKQLSSNARYLLGMAATYAVVNGARSYIGTGQAPDEWKDFVYPRTGGVTPQGKDERELLPSHIGQFTNYLHSGLGELGNELSPGLKLMYHITSNSDFRGLPITNENNSWFSSQRWGDYLKYVLGENTPIGIKNFLQGEKKGSNISTLEQTLGARPAPRFITDPEGYDAMMKRTNDKAYQRKLRSDASMARQYENSDEDKP